jgi:AcrR family transcriptional regulator
VAFASGEEQVFLEAIAKDAGVGIGTLYRHFPKREALVEAVYEDQVERLAASARELLARHAPADAFRSWMALFIDWAATKHGMIDTLRALMSSGRVEAGQMRAQLVEIVSLFLSAAGAAGDLRIDVAATLVGVLAVAGTPDRRAQVGRMLDLVPMASGRGRWVTFPGLTFLARLFRRPPTPRDTTGAGVQQDLAGHVALPSAEEPAAWPASDVWLIGRRSREEI